METIQGVFTKRSMDNLVSFVRSEWKNHIEGGKHIARMTIPVWTALIVSFVSMVASWGNLMGYLGLVGVVGFSVAGYLLVQSNRRCQHSAECFLYIWLGVLFNKMESAEEVQKRILDTFPEFKTGLQKRYG